MHYSISDLEKLSGIQSHTIRIWEQRYHALTPLRSAGNTRYYDDAQLKKLLNIVSLNQSGLKISQICALSEEEIKNLIEKDIASTTAEQEEFEQYISQLLIYGIAYDEYGFDQLLTKCIQVHEIPTTYKSVIYPLLVRLGLMWQKDSICPAQEHFLSNLIRQKLYAAIDNLPAAIKTKPTWLLFLPEDEGHDIGLLFSKYVLRKAGQKVIYLGSHVPLTSLKEAMNNNKINHLLLFMVHTRHAEDAQNYLNTLTDFDKTIQIHLTGSTKLIQDLILPKNVNWFQNIEALESSINPMLK